MVLLKQKVLTNCSSDVKFFFFVFLPCDCVLNFTVKDSDKEQEEEIIPNYDEEGNYCLCVLKMSHWDSSRVLYHQ